MGRLLDKVMDGKREQASPKKTLIRRGERGNPRAEDARGQPRKGRRWQLVSRWCAPCPQPDAARKHATRPSTGAAKEAAQKAGVTLTVIDDGNGDPTPASPVPKSRTPAHRSSRTTTRKRAYIRQDLFGTPEFQEQYKQLPCQRLYPRLMGADRRPAAAYADKASHDGERSQC